MIKTYEVHIFYIYSECGRMDVFMAQAESKEELRIGVREELKKLGEEQYMFIVKEIT